MSYVITELCNGGTIADFSIRENKQFTPARFGDIIDQILCAVEYMHGVGLVHLGESHFLRVFESYLQTKRFTKHTQISSLSMCCWRAMELCGFVILGAHKVSIMVSKDMRGQVITCPQKLFLHLHLTETTVNQVYKMLAINDEQS